MYLDKIKIYADKDLIREINFKMGLNLISNKSGGSEGNTLGKTTVLALVYYCLGGDVESIYKTNNKLKSKTNTIKKELEESKYFVELFIKIDDKDFKIKRSLFSDSDNYIDNKPHNKTEFKDIISSIFIKTQPKQHPTWNEIKAKFIKTEVMNYAYLDFAKHQYNKPAYFYTVAWLYLLGYSDTDVLNSYFTNSKKLQALSRKKPQVNKISQQLESVKESILELEEKRSDFVVDNYIHEKKEDISQKKDQIAEFKDSISNLKTQINYAESSICSLQNDKTSIDIAQIKKLFEQFKVHGISGAVSEYGKVLEFHNSMISNKILYLEKNLKALKKELKTKEQGFSKIAHYEQEVINYFKQVNLLPAYDNISNDIKDKYVEQSQLEIQLKQEQHKSGLISCIEDAEKKFLSYEKILQDNIKLFNTYFKKYTKQVLKQDDLYIATKDDKTSEVELCANDGKKLSKSETKKYAILVDLAYLSFSLKKGLKVPKFIMVDSIEEIYEKDLQEIFNIATNIQEGQVIFTCLSDKLTNIDSNSIKASTILELSENDKLFKF